jgi:hypothetical protein
MLNAARIMQRCDQLARQSESASGLTRVFLSPEHRAASGGVSHNPAESIAEADAGVGARTLLRFIENFELRR